MLGNMNNNCFNTVHFIFRGIGHFSKKNKKGGCGFQLRTPQFFYSSLTTVSDAVEVTRTPWTSTWGDSSWLSSPSLSASRSSPHTTSSPREAVDADLAPFLPGITWSSVFSQSLVSNCRTRISRTGEKKKIESYYKSSPKKSHLPPLSFCFCLTLINCQDGSGLHVNIPINW